MIDHHYSKKYEQEYSDERILLNGFIWVNSYYGFVPEGGLPYEKFV